MRGETVSHYEILEELGGGGMGVVYKALDTRLRRHVALKFLPAELTRNAPAKQRFLLEAHAASTLDHPNVCTVHEVDETPDGRLFIAMAYYQGQSLRQRIEQGPLGVPEALKIALQVARGLEAAHRAGIVHRDVKPANIMLPPGGEVKVLDFGLAKLEGEARRLTRTGTTMGTVAYMSPEQASGDTVDARSDLWSLGVVLYEMLTGRLPFKGERDHSLIYSILHDTAAALRTHLPGAPRAVERLLERLLEKDPRHRYQSATEVVAALEALARGENLAATELALSGTLGRALRRRRRTLRWAAPVAVALIALAAAGWLGFRAQSRGGAAAAARPALRNLAVLPFANLTGDPKRDYYCDGLSAVFVQQLSALPGFSVVGRSDTSFYKGKQKGSKEIARELGVGAIIEGQLIAVGDKLRLQANVVDAVRGVVIGGQSVEGTPEELLRRADGLAPELARLLDVELRPEAQARLAQGVTQNAEAYDLYLRALQLLDAVDNPQSVELASQLLEEAVGLDPEFALAHAEFSKALLWRFRTRREPSLLERAREAATRAVTLRRDLPEARIALARVHTTTGNHADAITELRHVAAMHPESDAAYLELAKAYGASRDLSQAEASLRQAVKIRPEFWGHWNDLGRLLWQADRQKGAVDAFTRAAELAPAGVTRPLENLGALAIQEGDFAAAATALERIPKPITSAGLATNLGTAYFYLGRLDEAEENFRLAVRLEPQEPLFHANVGDLLLRRGDSTAARRAYRQAADLYGAELKIDPGSEFATLRRASLLAKAGDCGEPLATVRRLAGSAAPTDTNAHFVAEALAACGDRKEALKFLRLAIERGYLATMVAQEADFQSLSGEDEYRTLVAAAAEKR
jgi:Flp pilus assembly protein TadD/TolB-like protein